MKYTSYLFDFDGTLVDSMPYYVAAMLRILDEGSISYGEDIVKTITPLGYLGTARYYIRELGLALCEEEAVRRMKAYAYDAYAHTVPAKATVADTLRELVACGADLHVLTASPHEVLDACLYRLGLFDLFTNVWSCDDFGTTKTDPEIYRMAAERIGRPVGEVLFLDDNPEACRTAKAAGMSVFGVYDESSAAYREEMETLTDRYIVRLSDLLSPEGGRTVEKSNTYQ